MMEPLRFGIVGCGIISGTHGNALKKLEAEGLARLVAAADTDQSARGGVRRGVWRRRLRVAGGTAGAARR